MKEGLIQVYTGEGKGKTTAAVGLAVRALGQGLRVLLVRFLKPEDPESGEVTFLKPHPNVEILTSGEGIIGGAFDREKVAAGVAATLQSARGRIREGGFDLVVLDEINNAVHRGYLPLKELLSLLEEKPPEAELVLTGRNAPTEILERADLITRMEAVRHPFSAGVAARRGIEF